MDIARHPSRIGFVVQSPRRPSSMVRAASRSPAPARLLSATASTERTALPGSPAALLTMPIEHQARLLLAAVAQPGDVIRDVDAVVDYITHLLVHTTVLSDLMDDLARDGALDRDLRPILGALFGVYGTSFFNSSPERQQIKAALTDVEGWHERLLAQSEPLLVARDRPDARCPISLKTYAEIDLPVSLDSGHIPHVFEAEAVLQWMQVSMQTPGRHGLAVNPLDRSILHFGQLKPVDWAGHQQQNSF